MLKAQEWRIRLQKLKGELIERVRAKALVSRLAGSERDAWVTWPARVAALMAAELAAEGLGDDTGETAASFRLEPALMQKALERHVRDHLDELAEVSPTSGDLGSASRNDLTGFDGAAELLRAWDSGPRPDPDLTVSQWAGRHRMLSGRASAEPGRCRTARS